MCRCQVWAADARSHSYHVQVPGLGCRRSQLQLPCAGARSGLQTRHRTSYRSSSSKESTNWRMFLQGNSTLHLKLFISCGSSYSTVGQIKFESCSHGLPHFFTLWFGLWYTLRLSLVKLQTVWLWCCMLASYPGSFLQKEEQACAPN